jgi:hypothetical protein
LIFPQIVGATIISTKRSMRTTPEAGDTTGI